MPASWTAGLPKIPHLSTFHAFSWPTRSFWCPAWLIVTFMRRKCPTSVLASTWSCLLGWTRTHFRWKRNTRTPRSRLKCTRKWSWVVCWIFSYLYDSNSLNRCTETYAEPRNHVGRIFCDQRQKQLCAVGARGHSARSACFCWKSVVGLLQSGLLRVSANSLWYLLLFQ